MKCPICGHWVYDADCWAGTMCLRCALKLEQESKQNGIRTNITDRKDTRAR